MGFFDQYERFLATSETGAWVVRLNARHRAIIESNVGLIRDRRVLDIASHDGRWSFAALKAGASHVIGIEARPRLKAVSDDTFKFYGVAPDRFEFVLGDAFDVMRQREFVAETVLLLGFFYHTARHCELAALLAATGASHIILDGNIIPAAQNPSSEPLVKLRAEPTESEANGIGPDSKIIVGHPSREAISVIFGQHGFTMTEFDWGPMRGPQELYDYNDDQRSTFVLSR